MRSWPANDRVPEHYHALSAPPGVMGMVRLLSACTGLYAATVRVLPQTGMLWIVASAKSVFPSR
jgi:hypothetical protein